MTLMPDLPTTVSANVLPRVTGQTRGRALYIGRSGELYIARRYAIYRSDDWGGTWRLDCFVPCRNWKPLVVWSKLAARLLRHYIAAFEVLDDGTRVAVARDGVYRAAPGEARMTRVFTITRGSRPLQLAVDGNRVLFGEYGQYLSGTEMYIYVSEDGGKTFHVGYCFPPGDIAHVHSILRDPYQDGYWVLVGEYGRQPGIGLLAKDLRTLDWLQRGNQQVRAAAALVEPDCLLYGSDSNTERNFLFRMDKRSGKIEPLVEVEGSSLYATTFGPVRAISTAVEPSPVSRSRDCVLYTSRNGADWQRGPVYKKDRHGEVYFHIGTLVLPSARYGGARGIFSGQATEQIDNEVCFIDFS
jgi:hypothetical protein